MRSFLRFPLTRGLTALARLCALAVFAVGLVQTAAAGPSYLFVFHDGPAVSVLDPESLETLGQAPAAPGAFAAAPVIGFAPVPGCPGNLGGG